jgi:lipopolysaccharide heptosyltransferase II
VYIFNACTKFLGEKYNNILLIDLAYIGDLLMATPAISEIKKNYPGARIAVLCSPLSSEVLKRNPDIDEIIEYHKESAGFSGMLRMARSLRQRRFNVAFIFHRAFGSAVLAFLAGIRKRVGFSTECRRMLLTDPVRLDKAKHRADNDLAVLKAVGLEVDENAPLVFIPDPADENFPREALDDDAIRRGYVVLNPNASWETKKWPLDRFKALVERIDNEIGLVPVGIGSGGEKDVVSGMLNGRGVNLAGRTSLSQLAVLCREAVAVVSNDSGPMHIAAAMDSNLIAIFGPTSPARCGPRSERAVVLRDEGLDCIGCYKKQCDIGLECMDKVDVDLVFNKVKAFYTEKIDQDK